MKINVTTVGEWGDKLTLSLDTAAKEPAPGRPGNTPGEVQLTAENQGIVSLGQKEKLSAEALRRAGGGIAAWVRKYKVEQVGISLAGVGGSEIQEAARALCEGLVLGNYQSTQYKTKAKGGVDTQVTLLEDGDLTGTEHEVHRAGIIAGGANLARSWGNEPPNVLNPVSMAARCQDLAQVSGLNCRVLDDKELAEMGAGAIVSVGQASNNPSRLIILEYSGHGKGAGQQPVVLVGKAITFDTGGYSLKTKEGIVGMKFDMSGGGAVAGIMQAVAALKPQTTVVGLIAAAENMISNDAYRPNDIITSLSGQTIEIISTDAEGRMVLADALTYAQQEYQPRVLINMATLTGGTATAFAGLRGSVMGNNPGVIESLITAGERVHERLWQLPLDEEYFDLIKSSDADFKNSAGSPPGSAIVGGTFLKQFVNPDVPWAHIDIAGMASTRTPRSYTPAGATGFGVRLILEYLGSLE